MRIIRPPVARDIEREIGPAIGNSPPLGYDREKFEMKPEYEFPAEIRAKSFLNN